MRSHKYCPQCNHYRKTRRTRCVDCQGKLVGDATAETALMIFVLTLFAATGLGGVGLVAFLLVMSAVTNG